MTLAKEQGEELLPVLRCGWRCRAGLIGSKERAVPMKSLLHQGGQLLGIIGIEVSHSASPSRGLVRIG